jgi:dipeptidyl aminopeptidase/acylaminoacyl peptidase
VVARAPVAPPAPASSPAAAPVPALTSGYDKPPPPLLDVLHAPSPPVPYVSPTGNVILLGSWVDYPPMARVAEPFLRLAGVRVEPRNRSVHDTPGGYGIRPCIRDYTLASVPAGAEIHVALPPGACPGPPLWSADGARFAFENAAADAVELWIGDAATGQLHRVPGIRLNPMLGSAVRWTADQQSLLVKLVPDGLGPPPPPPVLPSGPSIQEANGERGESSTYETRDTLTSTHDEALFDYYATSQLAVVNAASGAITRAGTPGLYAGVDAAPDGVHVLVQAVHRPYSYVTTFERFAHDVAVWDLARNTAHVMASLPLADRVPVRGVPTGPRSFQWRSTEPATLVWAEALDGGDWKVTVPARDKVWMQKAPFTGAPVEITRTEQRFTGFLWGAAPGLAFLYEIDVNRHWQRVFTIDVDDRQPRLRVLWDLSTDERYRSPGTLVERELANGAWVARQDGDAVYLSGQGASPAGDRPFLDRLDLRTGKAERMFRSDRTAYESFLAFAATAPGRPAFLTQHESPSDPPNVWMRTLGAPVAGAPTDEPAFVSSTQPLTYRADPTPAVRAIKKRLVHYKRKDGVDLSFTLYTPPGYQEGTRVPAILYAYPLDYADPKKAGQVTGSEQTFTMLRKYQLLLLAGYAIIDRTAFPIVGDPKKAYDTYLEQLVADAQAAVDKAVELGVVDRDRVGITGHSHGALMTANLLAHSDLFRAGMATSGSYNKTLTPFGFQNEHRSVWDAPPVYLQVSPFFFADKMKLPILLMHGQDDANPGTTPLQSTKLYEAIRGNGGTVRLVLLPHEPHWYAAQESNEQYIAEMLRWFDRYVKNASPRDRAEPRPAARSTGAVTNPRAAPARGAPAATR